MKKSFYLPVLLVLLAGTTAISQNNGRPDIFQKAGNAASKVNTVIAVFQPYLLKARQLFYDGKQLAGEVRNASKTVFPGNGNNNNNGSSGSGSYPGSAPYGSTDTSHPAYSGSGSYNPSGSSGSSTYPAGSGTYNAGGSTGSVSGGSAGYPAGSSNYNPNAGGSAGGTYGNNGNSPQNYLATQSLPVNNPASINNDGTGNWGNESNGLYGNCLDALTGTVMGMGEAAQSPKSVDLLFFAPSDGQNTYHIMTPSFARSNGTYMTGHVSDQLQSWTDINETEVALTRLTLGQFEQIQNNNQIQNAVRNAREYAGYYSAVGQKLDGMVFALKAQLEGREVFALIAVVRQYGTSGNNGYLKIKIKSTGMDTNRDGQVDANAYLR